jgi:hypothetical protein
MGKVMGHYTHGNTYTSVYEIKEHRCAIKQKRMTQCVICIQEPLLHTKTIQTNVYINTKSIGVAYNIKDRSNV